MLVATPLDYGLAAYETITTPYVEQPDEWAFIGAMAQAAGENARSFRDLVAQQQAFSEAQWQYELLAERRRTELVRDLQKYRDLLPNFSDYNVMQQQIQWLMLSL